VSLHKARGSFFVIYYRVLLCKRFCAAGPRPATYRAYLQSARTFVAPIEERAHRTVNLAFPLSGAAATGSVQFRDGTRVLQVVPLQSGVAQFKIGSLSVGSHSITGTYSGDLTHTGATSAPVIQTVNKISTTTGLTSAPNPSKPGRP
jgi:Bacterial Ig-like domain (group 3)